MLVSTNLRKNLLGRIHAFFLKTTEYGGDKDLGFVRLPHNKKSTEKFGHYIPKQLPAQLLDSFEVLVLRCLLIQGPIQPQRLSTIFLCPGLFLFNPP